MAQPLRSPHPAAWVRPRSLGFRVDNLDAVAQTLRDAGIEIDEPNANAQEKYLHFRAPDGHLYELVERLPPRTSDPSDHSPEAS